MLIVRPTSGHQAPYRLSKAEPPQGFLTAGSLVAQLESQGRWTKVRHGEQDVWLKSSNLRAEGGRPVQKVKKRSRGLAEVSHDLLVDKANTLGKTKRLRRVLEECCPGECSQDHNNEKLSSDGEVATEEKTKSCTAGSVGVGEAGKSPPWLDKLEAYLSASTGIVNLSKPLPSALYPYQVKGATFGLARGGRFFLADEMGLGKSAQALAVASQYVEEWPLLIAAPTFLCLQWRTMVLEWLDVEASDIQVVRSGSSPCLGRKVVICSYELLRTQPRLRQLDNGSAFRVVILDESHRLKTRDSARTQALLLTAHAASRIILLSGTPAPNTAAELWAQLALLLPEDKVPLFEDFASRYATRVESKRLGTLWKGFKNSAELENRILRHIMLKRRKEDVASELPPLRRHLVSLSSSGSDVKDVEGGPDGNVELSRSTDFKLDSVRERGSADIRVGGGASENQLSQVIRELVDNVDLNTMKLGAMRAEVERRLGLGAGALDSRRELVGRLATTAVAKRLARDARELGEEAEQQPGDGEQAAQPSMRVSALRAKAPLVIEFLDPLLAAAAGVACRKLVLFAHHHSMLDVLEKVARKAGTEPLRIDGRLRRHQRDELVTRFQTDHHVRVAVCSMTACGEGVSFTAGDTVVFCELHWTPAVLEQCEARAHRHGQERPVDIYYLVGPGLDEWMWRVLEQKRRENGLSKCLLQGSLALE